MSYDMIKEEVPSFVRRIGDTVFHGSNNTILVLGTDRFKKGPASVKDGLGHVDAEGGGTSAGAVHLIAGRSDSSGDPDSVSDKSFLYLSMKSDVDEGLGLNSVGDIRRAIPAAVLKSDAVRIVYRTDLKISFSDGKNNILMDGEKVKISIGDKSVVELKEGKIKIDQSNGKSSVILEGDKVTIQAASKIVLGEGSARHGVIFEGFQPLYDGHQHPTPVGPTGPPLPNYHLKPRESDTSTSKPGSTEVNFP